MGKRARRAACWAFVLFAAVPCLAAENHDWPMMFIDPLRGTSLPLDPAQAADFEAGRWQMTTAFGYFNLYDTTWHLKPEQRDPNLRDQPLSTNELRAAEQRFGGDSFHRMDAEGWRIDLSVSRGFRRGIAMTLRLPWVQIGQPHWDRISITAHEIMGMSSAFRDIYPTGEAIYYARSSAGQTMESVGGRGGGLGDAALVVAGPAGDWLGGEHRWVAAVEGPTTTEAGLYGSGGWDGGLRWFGTWRIGSNILRFGAGYTWLGGSGNVFGVRRNDTPHVYGSYLRSIGGGTYFRLVARVDESPLADFIQTQLGDPSYVLSIGVRASIGEGRWFGFEIGENVPSAGVAPDFTLNIHVGTVLDPGTSRASY